MEMTCPKCHAKMRQFERNGVTIDQCTECRGIFLDRGELEHLVDADAQYNAPRSGKPASAPPPPPAAPGHYPPPASPYGHGGQPHYRHGRGGGGGAYYRHGRGGHGGHGHGHKRRKSFFESLFD